MLTLLATATSVLGGVVTADMMSGCLSEVVAVLPVTIPAAVQFIGLRKGINFVMGILHAA